ncbi:ABC transporter ATP-binding protein [Martelella endophytica]|uniref:ABC transporter ATP-binding protein n=1 Tax=Martelella endophytica TaxID=1486262 RepID=A0A0D5LNX9_MAREN|nr:ABC transporter ATP-binding protein [Martelella endophytica]AJY45467.1 ABC transporter ATP-binding protein [Martelella endophytica]
MANIEIRDVAKTYPGTPPVRALDNVDLSIAEGEFVALLGPSGCGKSTLLNILAGFESNTEGTVSFDGGPIAKPGPERAVVFQEAALFPWLTVFDNVAFGRRIAGSVRSNFEPEVNAMLEMVGLTDFRNAYPSQLSGGMRQRVGIARALIMQPRALLMDEPFGALDAQTRLTMQELLLSIWQKHKITVVFVTHDIDEAILLADRICVMSARPAHIAREIAITLPRPRSIDDLTSPEFVAYKAEIMHEMRHAHQQARRKADAA